MNEEALEYSFNLFKADGYNGTLKDYKALIKKDKEALNYSYGLFSSDGYNGNVDDFSSLMLGKQEGVDTAAVTAAPGEPQQPEDSTTTSKQESPFYWATDAEEKQRSELTIEEPKGGYAASPIPADISQKEHEKLLEDRLYQGEYKKEISEGDRFIEKGQEIIPDLLTTRSFTATSGDKYTVSSPLTTLEADKVFQTVDSITIDAYKNPVRYGVLTQELGIGVFENITEEQQNNLKEDIYRKTVETSGVDITKDSFLDMYQKNLSTNINKAASQIETQKNERLYDLENRPQQYLNSTLDSYKSQFSEKDQFIHDLNKQSLSIQTDWNNLLKRQSQMDPTAFEQEKARLESLFQQNQDAQEQAKTTSTYKMLGMPGEKFRPVTETTNTESLLFIDGYMQNQVKNEDLRKDMVDQANSAYESATSLSSTIYAYDPYLTPQQNMKRLLDDEVFTKNRIEQQGRKMFVDVKYKQPEYLINTTSQELVSRKLFENGYMPDENGNINVSIYDLNKLGVSSRNFEGLFDSLKNQVSDDQLNDIKAYEEELDATDANILGFYSATMLNKNIVDLEKPNSIVNITQNAAAAVLNRYGDMSTPEAMKFVAGDPQGDVRMQIDAFSNATEAYNNSEAVVSNIVPKIELTKEQQEKVSKSILEETEEGVGQFVPMLVEFGVLNAATGGLMSYGALGRAMMSLSKGNLYQRLAFHTVNAITEEAKMQVVFDFAPTTGGTFYAGGALTSKINPFKTRFKYLAPLFDKTVKSGVVGAGSAMSAETTTMLYNDLMDNSDFSRDFEEAFPSVDEVSRKLIVESLVFSAIGLTHLKRKDLHRPTKVLNTIAKLQGEIANIQKKGELSTEDQVKINLNTQAILGLKQKFISDTHATELNPTNEKFEQNFQRLVAEPAQRGIQAVVPEYKGFDIKFIEGAKERKRYFENTDGSVKAEFQPRGKGEKDLIIIDKSKYKAGIPMHEITHAAINSVFKVNPALKKRFTNTMRNTFKDFDLGYLSGTKLGESIKEAYGIKDLRNAEAKNLAAEEYLAFMAEILADPQVYYTNPKLASTLLNEVRLEVKDFLIENNLKSPLPKTAKDVFELFAMLGQKSRIGGRIEAKVGALTMLDKVNILKYNIVETKIGEQYSPKAMASRALNDKQKTSLDEILSKPITSNAIMRLDDLAKENVFEVSNSMYEKMSKEDAENFIPFVWRNEVDRILNNSGYANNPKFQEVKEDITTDVLVFGTENQPSQSVKGMIKSYKKETGQPLSKYIGQNLAFKINTIVKDKYPSLLTLETLAGERVERGMTQLREQELEEISFEEMDLSPGARVRPVTQRTQAVEEFGLIDPLIFIPKSNVVKFEQEVAENVKDIDLFKSSYSELRNIATESTANLFGVSYEKILDKSKNLSKGEVDNFQNEVIKLAKEYGNGNIMLGFDAMQKALLPQQNVPGASRINKKLEGVARDELIGTSTSVPNSILKYFYNKSERVLTAAGLPEYIKQKDITAEKFAEFFGINAEGKITTSEPRDRSSGSLLGGNVQGMLELFDRNFGNKIVRNKLQETLEQNPELINVIIDLSSGKSPVMASRKIQQEEALRKELERTDLTDAQKIKIITSSPGLQDDIFEAIKQQVQTGKKRFDEIQRDVITEDVLNGIKNLGVSKKEIYNVLSEPNVLRPRTGRNINEAKSKEFETNLKSLLESLPDEVLQVGKGFVKSALGLHWRTSGEGIGREILNKKEFLNENGNPIESPIEAFTIGSRISEKIPRKTSDVASINTIKTIYKNIGEKLDKIKVLEEKGIEADQITKLHNEIEKLQQKLTSPKLNQARIDIYNSLNKAKQEWLHGSSNKDQFISRLKYLTELARSTSQITNGVRQLTPIVAIASPKESLKGKSVKIEHADNMLYESLNSLVEIVNNKYIDRGIGIGASWRAVLGTKKEFKKLDELAGATNTAGIDKLMTLDKALEEFVVFDVNGRKTNLYDQLVIDTAREVIGGKPNQKQLEQVNAVFKSEPFKALMSRQIIDPKKENLDTLRKLYENRDKLNKANNKLKSLAKNNNIDVSKAETTSQIFEALFNKDKENADKAKVYTPDEISKEFNKIIQQKAGVQSFRFNKTFSKAEAKIIAGSKGKYDFWIPASAEDFIGLLYKTIPKGKQGEQALEFIEKTLLKPLARAESSLNRETVSMSNDFREVKKILKVIPKYLKKKNPTGFTNEQAMRAWMFDKGGHKVPGLSEKNLQDLKDLVEKDSSLLALGRAMFKVTKSNTYTKPGQHWLGGSIKTDMYNLMRKEKRGEYLQEFQENADAMFTEENLNKYEAAYGTPYRIALENSLKRIKEGRNRAYKNDLTNRMFDYINGSTAAIMFFNTKSALLQTISSLNFINWSFNNPIEAGKAFANQDQYWKDFSTLFNSDYLVSRRNGLKINVAEAEIADAGSNPTNKAQAVFAAIARKGYLPTQYMDSFAIAGGGATYYRNATKKYEREGLSLAEAEKRAFEDFEEIAEVSQQSSRADKISMQQASGAGRVILTFANTPMQYARLSKRAAQDIINGRGDLKTNISKIMYYQFAQNLLFNFLQSATFSLLFDDEQEDDSQYHKEIDVANGMANSILRGLGIYGATAAMVKDVMIKLYKEGNKERSEYENALFEMSNIAPPLDSKISKIRSMYLAADRGAYDDPFAEGVTLDNPALLPSAQAFTAITNIPADRVLIKMNNVDGALFGDYELWQRVSKFSGYQDWQLGIKDEEDNILTKEDARLLRRNARKTTRRRTTRRRTKRSRR